MNTLSYHPLIKILYIDAISEPKSTAALLEEYGAKISRPCSVTVVPNGFVGLECIEYTKFDIIFIPDRLEHLDALDFLQLLRFSRVMIPVILLGRVEDSSDDKSILNAKFDGILRVPYGGKAFFHVVSEVLKLNARSTNGSISSKRFKSLPAPIIVQIPPSIQPNDQALSTPSLPKSEACGTYWDEEAEIQRLLKQHQPMSTIYSNDDTTTDFFNSNVTSSAMV